MTVPTDGTPPPESCDKQLESARTGQSGDLAPTNPTPANLIAGVSATPPTTAALPWLGHITMIRSWKQGGLGEVLLGRDEQLHRDVAFKRIKAERASDSDARRRVELEAEITAKLEHLGIVPIYGMVQGEGGQPCYAMRFIHGETLKAAIEKWHSGLSEPRTSVSGPLPRGRGSAQKEPFDGLAFRALLQKFV